eukprot:CAMPEP_0180550554 /NCGR_PEP_ID=MMETSP1036_2-20121128/72716_1 /TAXON_ID=632150 /ORGANISM="Azadinium spinosum, Strain 3D9" /LENGTH=98 /DNA_ID=CAMNT_0022565833 /DNA_START=552 /DNA_END=845 /DNA_ORIENTATION=+
MKMSRNWIYSNAEQPYMGTLWEQPSANFPSVSRKKAISDDFTMGSRLPRRGGTSTDHVADVALRCAGHVFVCLAAQVLQGRTELQSIIANAYIRITLE